MLFMLVTCNETIFLGFENKFSFRIYSTVRVVQKTKAKNDKSVWRKAHVLILNK